ncbi:MAG TPA: DNA polymerase domain-containing protein [Candidatus Nitrosotenuis sp.]|jgi:DNA polymerase elongation subunit (family B)|nr:DNA polymerase domain-containing protein [Candidatus Nitrosotenuis sp.]
MSHLSLDDLPFAENHALFGADRKPGLLNVEVLGKGLVRTWWRREGATVVEHRHFRPFLWLTEASLLEGCAVEDLQIEEMKGPGAFKLVVRAPDTAALRKISQHVARKAGVAPNHPDSPQIFLNDFAHQYLLATGRTCFGGMAFADLRRMQVYLVADCAPGFEFSNPERDPILVLALADSTGWQEVLEGPEAQILEGFDRLVAERDPDVLEGHDLYKRVLPYLQRRARAVRGRLLLGRGGSAASSRTSRMFIAEKTIDYPRWEAPGRDLVDTWILTLLYDVSARDLESYDVQDVARQLGLGEGRPALLDFEAAALHRQDPAALRQYALERVSLVRQVAGVLSYPYFLQAQIFPYTYQNVILRGNATKVNALFLREYLRQKEAPPARSPGQPFAGGLTAQEHEGLARNVLHCDVQSLYPSIILAYGIAPRGDSLGIFHRMLTDLRDLRLEARRRERAASDPEERNFYRALQNTFKILINSFYGYLGFEQGHFADFQAAAEVTAKGRELLVKMMDRLRSLGGKILEVDTDGIYFVPPPGQDEEALEQALLAELPEGIRVELDGRYPAMYVHKMKNYALLGEDGKLILRGSALRSRSLEPYLRRFLEEMLALALQGRQQEIPALLGRYLEDLEQRRIPAAMLARTETLSDSLDTYRKKISGASRNRGAAYELALASGRGFRAGDSVSYYVTGSKANVTVYTSCRLLSEHDPAHPDENAAYYKKKLLDFYNRFAPTLGVPEAQG